MNKENLQYIEEYEREIISKILGAHDDIRYQILNALEPEMFINLTYKKFFSIAKKGCDVNFYSIIEKTSYEEQKQLLKDLQNEFVTSVNWKFYTTKIVDCYIERLIEAAKTYEEITKISEIKKKYRSSDLVMEDISQNAFEEVVGEYYDSMEYSVFTGYQNIDNITGSFQKGDFIILAGATSSGKSLLMLNIALNIARNQGKRVDIFSLEMQKKQLINRIVCAELGLNAAGYRKHNYTACEMQKYADFIEKELPKICIKINNTSRLSISQVVAAIKKTDAEVIFIDYLGLIRNPEVKNKYDRISEISMELKAAALDSNKILIVLHQLSRASKDRKDKKPILSDLRDSGQIEQDADVVMFVYRPHYYFESQPEDLMQVLIAKDRNGALGCANLICDLKKQKITNRIQLLF